MIVKGRFEFDRIATMKESSILKDSKIEIKNVTPNDAEFLYLLMNNDVILERLNEVPTTVDDWKEAINIWEDDSDEENYLVWLNDDRIGWFSLNNLESNDRVAYLKMAVLLPEYQHHRVGSIVLQRLLEDLKDRGYSTVMLYTNADNVNAQKCYQKCGFAVVEEFRDAMADGSCVGRYTMRRELGIIPHLMIQENRQSPSPAGFIMPKISL